MVCSVMCSRDSIKRQLRGSSGAASRTLCSMVFCTETSAVELVIKSVATHGYPYGGYSYIGVHFNGGILI